MTYFKHTEEHEIDCNCSYRMDVDLDKSIAREIERVIEVVLRETTSKLDDVTYRKVSDAIMRLDILRRYVPTQELPVKFERQVADAIKNHNKDD